MEGTYLGVIEFKGYREWTESIGSDREWKLQITQSKIYYTLQEIASHVNGFILPLRFDYMILVASGLNPKSIEKIYHAADSVSPVPVRIASSCGETPLKAIEKAWSHLEGITRGVIIGEPCSKDYVVAAHFDINGITERTKKEGLIPTYTAVLSLISKLQEESSRYGAIAQYLGGDNVLALLPYNNYQAIIESLIKLEDLKVGVGIARSSRRALTLAAEALHKIRESGADRIIVYDEL